MLSSELPSLVKYLIINSEEKPTVSLGCGFHSEVNGSFISNPKYLFFYIIVLIFFFFFNA